MAAKGDFIVGSNTNTYIRSLEFQNLFQYRVLNIKIQVYVHTHMLCSLLAYMYLNIYCSSFIGKHNFYNGTTPRRPGPKFFFFQPMREKRLTQPPSIERIPAEFSLMKFHFFTHLNAALSMKICGLFLYLSMYRREINMAPSQSKHLRSN